MTILDPGHGKPKPAPQVQADWNASTGPAAILNKPSTMPPAPHPHQWSALSSTPTTLAGYGITDAASSSQLGAKFNTPTGSTGQYLRGDGSPAAFPSTMPPSAHTQPWSTITATPTTLAGYGITDAATSAQLGGKFNTPTGTAQQYVRGDGSLGTFPAARRIEAYAGTTNAQGQISVTYPTAFAAVPLVQPPAPAAANQVWTTVSSTTTGFTLQLNQRNTVTLLSIEVLLGATVPVVGTAATVLVVAQ